MIKLPHFFTLFFSFCFVACQQPKMDVYDENNYVEHSRGVTNEMYTVVYYFNKDTNYILKKVYPDSLYRDTPWAEMKYFLHKNVMEGPTENYSKGRLVSKGFMKKNKRHGEFIYYELDGILDKRQFYDMGERIGVWEDYYSTGVLFKKMYYDKGMFVKQEIFDRKRNGKLVRIEYAESWEY